SDETAIGSLSMNLRTSSESGSRDAGLVCDQPGRAVAARPERTATTLDNMRIAGNTFSPLKPHDCMGASAEWRGPRFWQLESVRRPNRHLNLPRYQGRLTASTIA